jgi:hypothetical protein
MDLHEKEEEKSIGQVIGKLEDTRSLMFRGSRAIQAKNSWHKVRELVQAFIKVRNTAVEHRVDPAIFSLVNMPAVWDKLQDELAKEGEKTAVRHYQNILQLHASFWADADTLHVAVVVPIMRTDATIFFFLEAFCDISHRLGGITPFGVFSDAFPGLKMWVTLACATANFLTQFIISIAVLENVPPDAGLQKRATFPH